MGSGPKPTEPEHPPHPQRPSLSAHARERTAAKQRAFLEALGEFGTITAACKVSRIGRRTIYDMIGRDPQFAEAFNLARDAAADLLEAEARRRGMEGVPEAVYFQGRVVGHITRFSDCCLMALLSAYRPERFGRRRAAKPSERSPAAVHVAYDFNLRNADPE